MTLPLAPPTFRRLALLGLAAAMGCARLPAPSAPVAAPKDASQTHFAVIGDFGEAGDNARRVAHLVHAFGPEFIVTTGDNNYPDGAAETLDDNVGQYYGDYIAFKPGAQTRFVGRADNRFFPTLGNHDWRAEGALPYLRYFDLPGHGRYYTVARGAVRFFMVDSDPHEPDGVEPDGRQARWLKGALAAAQEPWKVVVLHHSPYSSGGHGSNKWMQWPYKTWGADLVLAGHDHDYEHAVIDGMHYVVMGLSGASKDTFPAACALKGATRDDCFDHTYGALEGFASDARLELRLRTIDGRTQDRIVLSRGAAAQGVVSR